MTVAIAQQLAATGPAHVLPLALAGGGLLIVGALMLTIVGVRRRV